MGSALSKLSGDQVGLLTLVFLVCGTIVLTSAIRAIRRPPPAQCCCEPACGKPADPDPAEGRRASGQLQPPAARPGHDE